MGIFITIFLVLFAIALLAVALGTQAIEKRGQQRVREVLQTTDMDSTGSRRRKVVIKKQESNERVDSLVDNLGVFKGARTRLEQSGVKWSIGRFLISSLVLAMLGGIIGYYFPIFVYPSLSAAITATLFCLTPHFYVMHQRSARMAYFEEQFPEALEFVARSMRAGHAFNVTMGMAGEDAPEPLGSEFRQTYNEQNLGAATEEALRGLSRRVPLIDVRFFVSAVLMQREVGGNLAEILDNLAEVIRERFRIKGHVRAVSAHGRLTATILVIMPLGLLACLMFVAPSYLQTLAEDEHGQYLIIYAIAAQFVGIYFIRRIVRIKI